MFADATPYQLGCLRQQIAENPTNSDLNLKTHMVLVKKSLVLDGSEDGSLILCCQGDGLAYQQFHWVSPKGSKMVTKAPGMSSSPSSPKAGGMRNFHVPVSF